MIQVVYQKQGGERKLTDAKESITLAEVRQAAGAAGMLASVNGDSETDDSRLLDDNDFVSFTEQVKGAARKAATKKSVKKASKSTKK